MPDKNELPLFQHAGMESPVSSVAELAKEYSPDTPLNLGKAIRLPVPDFSNPDRPLTCLEVDFPIAPINALSSPNSTVIRA